MNKLARRYIGVLAAIVSYYIVHEGAHLLYALATGVFKKIRFMGIGMQIVVEDTAMTNSQLGLFCLVSAVATLLVGYALVLLTGRICRVESLPFRAIMYYITIAMLLMDPLYLSLLCGFFGGGDMNGISLLLPELAARLIFGALLILNGLIFWKIVLPKYTRAIQK